MTRAPAITASKYAAIAQMLENKVPNKAIVQFTGYSKPVITNISVVERRFREGKDLSKQAYVGGNVIRAFAEVHNIPIEIARKKFGLDVERKETKVEEEPTVAQNEDPNALLKEILEELKKNNELIAQMCELWR